MAQYQGAKSRQYHREGRGWGSQRQKPRVKQSVTPELKSPSSDFMNYSCTQVKRKPDFLFRKNSNPSLKSTTLDNIWKVLKTR